MYDSLTRPEGAGVMTGSREICATSEQMQMPSIGAGSRRAIKHVAPSETGIIAELIAAHRALPSRQQGLIV